MKTRPQVISKEQLLEAAVTIAINKGDYSSVYRVEVAKEADCSEASVTKYFGTMTKLKKEIVRYALKREIIPVLTQALGKGDEYVKKKMSPELKKRVVQNLVD